MTFPRFTILARHWRRYPDPRETLLYFYRLAASHWGVRLPPLDAGDDAPAAAGAVNSTAELAETMAAFPGLAAPPGMFERLHASALATRGTDGRP